MTDDLRIAAVVVARDRPDVVRTTLEAIVAQVPAPDALVLVANGATAEVVAVLNEAAAAHGDAEVIELGRNTGAAGGFHAGLARVAERGDIAFACCFDDDARPLPGCLAALAAVARERPRVGTVGAVSHDGTGHLAWDMHLDGATEPVETVDEVRRADGGAGALPVAAMCWHGLMVPVDVVRAHGNVDADLFLQFEDAEFGLRLRGAGLVNYLVPDAEVIHPRRPPARVVRILGRRIAIGQESAAKEYLSLRNELVVHRRHGGIRFWTLSGPLILLRGLLTAFALEIPRTKALRHVFARAVIDAARGRLGPPPPGTAALG